MMEETSAMSELVEKVSYSLTEQLAKKTQVEPRQVQAILDVLGFNQALEVASGIHPSIVENATLDNVRACIRLARGTVAR